jgi:hypothetical protein
MEIVFQTKADCEQQLKARVQVRMYPRTPGPTPFLACQYKSDLDTGL